jgi:nucleoid-associated protein YgaU
MEEERVMRLPFGKKEAPAPKGKTIKSMPGDTLRIIAVREYGDESKWEVIYDANKWRIDDPSYLNVGTDLLLPGKE